MASIFQTRKEFGINVEYADTVTRLPIVNQIQSTNTSVSKFNQELNKIKNKIEQNNNLPLTRYIETDILIGIMR